MNSENIEKTSLLVCIITVLFFGVVIYRACNCNVERININGVNYLLDSRGGLIKEDKQ